MTADDLEDGLEYEVDFAPSDNEADPSLVDHEDLPVEGQKDVSSTPMVTEAITGKKRKQKTNKLQDKKRIKMEMDIQQKKDLSKETSPEVIADFINQKIRHKNDDLSTLELAELYFNKSDIRSSAEFEEARTLENLSKYLTGRFKNMLPSKKEKKEKKNKNKKETTGKAEDDKSNAEERKFIAIVSMSAIRACDVHRSTRELEGSSLKLINKNKVDVDLKLVKTTRSRVLCCTPGRLIKVLNSEGGELRKDEIKIVIVDNSYLDSKCQNIWDIKETTEVLKELTKEGSKIYLY
ncbi:uncharacterized protein CANTADRAFT_27309 [Suhomyces tanzawaensis NRRL Y-17324]|uniref:Protein CMS1 n=1 Tax=Suhomyces tanzawaensis NRRL Y-17324 TaxID=984487 RepID=A0A1E4SDE4_9ASCO|nr:uncharacterized protein CANTADRAFT_27309 [Suhomyces tanzawaensis NRRL Y-17324]ODV77541.1 hypothetical protein CANTADRAFT_27309 [Suhomyces tanzawaensis NRRL Y-17324]